MRSTNTVYAIFMLLLISYLYTIFCNLNELFKMILRLILLILMLILLTNKTSANNIGERTSLGVMISGSSYFENHPKHDYILVSGIRKNGEPTSGLRGEFDIFSKGVIIEYDFLKWFVLSSGLNYSVIETKLEKDYGRSKSFYLEYSNSENKTDYFKVLSISRNTDCLSVPLQLSAYVFKSQKYELCIGGGLEYYLRLKENSNVIFEDEDMNKYKNEALKSIDSISGNFFETYLSIKNKLVINQRIKLGIDFKWINKLHSNSEFALVNPEFGFEAGLSLSYILN